MGAAAKRACERLRLACRCLGRKRLDAECDKAEKTIIVNTTIERCEFIEDSILERPAADYAKTRFASVLIERSAAGPCGDAQVPN